jgi:pyruvate dehydrogenase E2 component (dihydrolipoamide acetyltransferase)
MDILMPQLGETVAEGKITKWFKAAGDNVAPGENLFEIETDKTSMEVPATAAGVLSEIRVREGDIVPVGAVVAIMTGAAAAEPAPPPQSSATPATRAAAPANASTASPAHLRPRGRLDPFREVHTPERNFGPARLPGGTVVTPLARRLAAQAGIDLGALAPSGRRIGARDVEAFIARSAPAAGSAAPIGSAASPAALGGDPARVTALYEAGSYDEVPLDNMRRIIASRLIEAKQTIPHFYLTADVTIARLLEVREETNATSPAGPGGQPAYRLSVNDFVIKALALALRRVPAANAVWAHDRILRFHHADIGVAVAIEGGLITPVVRKAESKSIIEISGEVKDLAARARARRLKPHEFQGGASAISNLGMYGVREFAAIINPPQSSILAVGAGERRPVESADGIRFVSQMTVTLSCDHRVIDGALGAELLAAFKSLIEHPVGLLV